MISANKFKHISIYTNGFDITETENKISISDGEIFYSDTVHQLSSMEFHVITDESFPVYYQLSIVESGGVLEYYLERTVITPRFVPGYSGENNLIHVLVSFMLDIDSSTNGQITYVSNESGSEI